MYAKPVMLQRGPVCLARCPVCFCLDILPPRRQVLSELLEKSFASRKEYLEYPYRRLFGPLGAQSFRMEVDRAGHFVGSSLGFASARNWARLGQLMLQDGVWDGQQIVPKEYVKSIFNPLPQSGGIYAGGWWHAPPTTPVNLTEVSEGHAAAPARRNWYSSACPERDGGPGYLLFRVPSIVFATTPSHLKIPTQVYADAQDAACAAQHVADMRASLQQDVPESAVMAMGFRQQWLVVSPVDNMVVVRLGHNWPVDQRSHFYRNIVSALYSDDGVDSEA